MHFVPGRSANHFLVDFLRGFAESYRLPMRPSFRFQY
jgi:hypothetical protein